MAADGARLFSCAGAGGVWVWDASTLALLQKLLPHFAPDSLLLVRAPPLITAAAAAANAAANAANADAANAGVTAAGARATASAAARKELAQQPLLHGRILVGRRIRPPGEG